ncbi:RNA methyltransferase [Verrucomicrobiales bacterium BCK34]|nr:RNA methyltransferase [Verrucomicrobiales bacterium BCK34]
MTIKQQPIVILVEPQLGENIGMCARAMLNCGLEELRLVNPRDGWPSAVARQTAADADRVIDGVRVFSSLEEALADCHRVFATTARDRSITVPLLNAGPAALEMKSLIEADQRVGILFGPEASGLTNDDLVRADTLVRFPTNPEFSSLNLAQCVLLFGWEWRRVEESETVPQENEAASDKAELFGFVNRLERSLDEKGFFLSEEQKPSALRTLRGIFSKAQPTERELNFLHGALTALIKDRDDS